MKLSFRWYGESDPISLEYIRQIPNMRSVVTAVYDVKPGEVWPEESLEKLKEQAQERTKNKLASNDSDSCVDVSQYLTKSGEGNIPDNAMDELTTNFSRPIDELLKKAK